MSKRQFIKRITWRREMMHITFFLAAMGAACFGVFRLPFLFPPPVLPIVSAANAAGFNNKVAALSLACVSVAVFFISLRMSHTRLSKSSVEHRQLSRRLAILVSACPVLLSAILCACVVKADVRYADFSYFIEQIQKSDLYGRQLYSQIEFPYGPLLFYVPIWIRAILAPISVSGRTAYIITLLLEQFTGGLLLAWIINNIPIERYLKLVFFLSCTIGWFHWGLGLNYTMFRFTGPLAILIFTTQRSKIWQFIAASIVGEVFCLAVSPEMGLAFMAATFGLTLYLGWVESHRWWTALLAPFAGILFFIAIAGKEYLRMLSLFAKGVYNFIVEPAPFVLIFILAVVVVVPPMLGRAFLFQSTAIRTLGSLYIFSLALLPVALGRADSAHIFYNGLGFYILSMVAVARFSAVGRRMWLVCVVFVALFPLYIGYRNNTQLNGVFLHDALSWQTEPMVQSELDLLGRLYPVRAERLRNEYEQREADSKKVALDVTAIERMTGSAPIATPIEVPNDVERILKQSGHYTPLFYDFQIAILDKSAEEREVKELTQYEWILSPRELSILQSETPRSSVGALGFTFPYSMSRSPYVSGHLLLSELHTNWEGCGAIGKYILYHKRGSPVDPERWKCSQEN
jgi:hypothetical protein